MRNLAAYVFIALIEASDKVNYKKFRIKNNKCIDLYSKLLSKI